MTDKRIEIFIDRFVKFEFYLVLSLSKFYIELYFYGGNGISVGISKQGIDLWLESKTQTRAYHTDRVSEYYVHLYERCYRTKLVV